MKNPPVQLRPAHFIESVDNALRALQLIRDEGPIRVKEVADELGVAQSTAYRVISMLVYRGFALQDDDRRYIAGPALSAGAIPGELNRVIRRLSADPLRALMAELGESVFLMVRTGTNVRIISSFESEASDRLTKREGAVMPARRTGGGKALLSYCSPDLLGRLYSGRVESPTDESLSPAGLRELRDELAECRRLGYATNRGEYEPGIGTVGVAVQMEDRPPLAAFSVGTPLNRFGEFLNGACIEALARTRDELKRVYGQDEKLARLLL